MTDIPFTLKSYEKIGARSARRGNDITLHEPEVRRAVEALAAARKNYKNRQKNTELLEQNLQDEKTRFIDKRNSLRNSRNIAVRKSYENALTRLNNELEEKKFAWQLLEGPKIGDRQTYEISKKFYHRITAKQVEASLAVATRRYQPSRHSIVASLKQALDKSFSYGVIKLDIKKFFDSVPHENLLKIVNSNNRIDSITKILVRQLIVEFEDVNSKKYGIPQGVGISSKLADVFLQKIDDDLITDPNTAFYARFVDDMIIITKNPKSVESLKEKVIDQLRDIGLEENNDNRKSITFTTDKDGCFPPDVESFEYLGYRFRKPSKGQLEVHLSETRIRRIESKLQRSFSVWKEPKKIQRGPDNSGRDGLLSDRVRFLTTNTSLHNNKEKVSVGIFFSNREITNPSQLEKLDEKLKELISNNSEMMSDSLKKRLGRYSFQEGFREKQFSRFDLQKLKRISACWGDLK